MHIRILVVGCAWTLCCALLALPVAAEPAQTAATNSAQAAQVGPGGPSPGLAIHFLDAGAGDAAWVTLPDGSTVLIDCGPAELSKQLLVQLQAAGVTSIDLLAPSRPTPDATGGCSDVVRYVGVRSVLWAATMNLNASGNRLDAALTQARTGRETAVAGWTRDYGAARLSVLNPPDGPVSSELDDSLVLLLEYGGSGVLFAGGIHRQGESQVTAAIDPLGRALLAGRSITVLRAADHGVAGTSGSDFLGQVFPTGAQAVVLSYAATRGAPQPDPATRSRLVNLVAPRGIELETARNGAITITLALDGTLTWNADHNGGAA